MLTYIYAVFGECRQIYCIFSVVPDQATTRFHLHGAVWYKESKHPPSFNCKVGPKFYNSTYGYMDKQLYDNYVKPFYSWQLSVCIIYMFLSAAVAA
jgi:hypothetical protein